MHAQECVIHGIKVHGGMGIPDADGNVYALD